MSLTILSSRIDNISYLQAVAQIISWTHQNGSRSVYAANVHMLMEAHDHADFMQIVNAADLVAPDGMPLVWVLRKKGVPSSKEFMGPL